MSSGSWAFGPAALTAWLVRASFCKERLLALGYVRWIILMGRGLRMSKRVRPRQQDEGGETESCKWGSHAGTRR